MMLDNLSELITIAKYRGSKPDDVFICCSSFEERCLGSIIKFDDYKYNNGYIFYYDEPDEMRDRHQEQMERILKASGPCTEIPASVSDPIFAIAELSQKLSKLHLDPYSSVITVDITTLTKTHLLLLLKALDLMGLMQSLRIIYTEPKDYITDLYLSMSIGIRDCESIPGFISVQPLSKPVLLIIFLGYEGDRAMALYNNLDPNATLLIVPSPAYHSEWEGRTELLNQNLINLIGRENVIDSDPLNPTKVYSRLYQILMENIVYDLKKWNCCIAPLGTKPQALGLYLFWRKHPAQFSIIYASPLKHNKLYYSTGIGKTWLLQSPGLI